jgi:hypothetical protein
MKFQKIQKEYSLFVNEFIAWCESAGVEVHVPASSNVDVRRNENGQIEVRSLFHLARWPFKGASKKVNGNLTVLVRTKEVYEDGYFLIKSNVNTLYFKPMKKGDAARPHTAIHYDYEFAMASAHPIFHAQFGAKPIDRTDLAAVSFDRELDLSAFEPIGSIRIPTVHIGLPAALLALTADHLNRDYYYGFLEYVSKHPFFNKVTGFRLDRCREKRMHSIDQWVYQSHNIYM